MSDEQQRHNGTAGPGGWQPIPRGAEYDEGTTFLQLPPELLAHPGTAPAGTGAWDPLAATGAGGYTPPVGEPWQQPLAHAPAQEQRWTGEWDTQAAASYEPPRPEASAQAGGADPHATAEWAMPFGGETPADTGEPQGQDQGHWTVPAAGDDPVDESGEYLVHATNGPQDTDGHGMTWPEPAGGAHAWEQPVPDAVPAVASAGGPLGADTGSTGQWSIPVAPGDTPEESGEYPLDAFAGAAAVGAPEAPTAMAQASPSASASAPGAAGGVTGTSDNPTDAWTPEAVQQAAPDAGDAEARPGEPEPEPEPLREPEPEPVAPASAELPDDAAPGEPAPAEPALREAEPIEMPGAHLESPDGLDGPHDIDGPDDLGPLSAPFHTEHPCASYVLRVNGTDRPVTDAWIGESLLYVLRERLGLAGAKDGCSQGECGACSVQVDGRLVASCLVPAATAAGSEVRTVEGLATDGRPSDVQRALADCGAVQCGFCVPGMAMTMHDLLEGNHAPTELETRQAICGNLCRCSGYRGVLDAVRQVVDERAEASAAQDEAQPGADQSDQARIPHQAGPHGGGSGRAAE
ncbi:2Fe-2S iron-sulfur cluster-binding protein [Streptomyces sp. ISL-11]|uniref:2Fe-2S iron-sulfur cluster-binding protein n=1 Tax=Streptomyces sp. ISL-11 TaxID=2819174 RepID=UPI001BE844A3|nr:2Fe-2S iron-sulfur cluster-binding protein [Streptomyces sp. ISL-11]MBT2383788.1 (2Fe-2S)-binding protein [Streptomyces sp. ISL-11]